MKYEAENGGAEEFVQRAYELFDEFYNETLPFRQKCLENEEFYKANHWHNVARREPGEPQPVTPVLFSTLESMLSDIMDSYPEAVLLPQEEGDEALAAEMGDIVNYVLKRRKYRTIYRKKCREALKKGASVQEVFWDPSLYDGLGDVNVRQWDIANFLWDPKCEDIQEGRAVFKFGFYSREWFEARYPGKSALLRPDEYVRREDGGSTDDVMVIEYWYKKYDDKGLPSVHMAKLAGGALLERSEDALPQGMYSHGKYPFIVEPLYPLAGQPVGLGIIDIFKNMQQYADKLDQIILKNTLMSGRVKLLVNRSAELDEEAIADWSREVVRGGRIDDGAVRWFQPAPLNPYVLNHYHSKIEAIKEESGQTLFSRGEGGRGITAALAIMAMQEAGSKRSRIVIEQLFDGFEELVGLIIATIFENYTEERRFRITGERDYTAVFSQKKVRRGLNRFCEFDISVNVQKQTPYRTLYQNELALQLLRAGVIMPSDALGMMTFAGRDKVLRAVREREEREMAGTSQK